MKLLCHDILDGLRVASGSSLLTTKCEQSLDTLSDSIWLAFQAVNSQDTLSASTWQKHYMASDSTRAETVYELRQCMCSDS